MTAEKNQAFIGSRFAISHPPRVALAFRVGIVGHRPNRLKHAVEEVLSTKLHETLAAIKDEVGAYYQEQKEHDPLYAEEAPVLRALSPLAEGVDRMFADQALLLDYKLAAVLPFERLEFANDIDSPTAMEPNSRARFQGLLKQATTVFELDGTRDDSESAYGVAGDVVLNQSDILIVVWDGERKNLRGGTEETFDRAVERGVPVVWIDAHAPHHWRVVDKPLRKLDDLMLGMRASLTKSATISQLRSRVRHLVALPAAPRRQEDSHHKPVDSPRDDPLIAIQQYYAEGKPNVNKAFWWKLFRDLVGDFRLSRPPLLVVPYEKAVQREWPSDRTSVVGQTIAGLRPYYAWSDKLADRYADAYRGAFVMAFLAAASAVALALLPNLLKLHAHGLAETLCTVGELSAIVFILVVVFWGRSKQWHSRWLDYRLLAEMIRHQRLVAHLGGERATPSVAVHLQHYGDPGNSWMAWYARAVERSIGLPTAVVDKQHLLACLEDLIGQLGSASDDPKQRTGQVGFHQTTSERCVRIEHRLHLVEIVLLVSTLACCVFHLTQSFLHEAYIPTHWLIFFCGTLPALGAALAGISNQGEFRRIAKRSRSMQEGLGRYVDRFAQLKKSISSQPDRSEQLSPEIAAAASEAARLMINEVLDWRVMLHDRPLRTT